MSICDEHSTPCFESCVVKLQPQDCRIPAAEFGCLQAPADLTPHSSQARRSIGKSERHTTSCQSDSPRSILADLNCHRHGLHWALRQDTAVARGIAAVATPALTRPDSIVIAPASQQHVSANVGQTACAQDSNAQVTSGFTILASLQCQT